MDGPELSQMDRYMDAYKPSPLFSLSLQIAFGKNPGLYCMSESGSMTVVCGSARKHITPFHLERLLTAGVYPPRYGHIRLTNVACALNQPYNNQSINQSIKPPRYIVSAALLLLLLVV